MNLRKCFAICFTGVILICWCKWQGLNEICRANFTFMWPCIVTNFFLIKPKRRTNFPNLFCQETLHVSGSSSAHQQEFSTVHSALVYVMQFWWQLSSTTRMERPCLTAVIKTAWHIPVPNVQWKTPDDGQRNCPKHVEFLDKNKFGKLLRVGFIRKKRDNMSMYCRMVHWQLVSFAMTTVRETDSVVTWRASRVGRWIWRRNMMNVDRFHPFTGHEGP